MSNDESTAESEGIVDQQDAVLEKMEHGDAAGIASVEESTAERAGIVDQQDAALEAMEDSDDTSGGRP